MQASILEFFSNISVPWLDQIAEAVTMLGEQYFFIAVITLIYWNISKREGIKLASAFLYSAFLNSLLKIVFHTPRPFEKLGTINAKRLQTATGYSFPSGHTQHSTTFFITLAQIIRRRWFSVIALVVIILIGVSRVYLGVHWPVDVIGGWILGVLVAYVFCSIVDSCTEDSSRLRRIFIGIQTVVILVTIFIFVLDLVYLKGSMKIEDFFKISGITSGGIYGYLIEERYFDFSAEDAGLVRKIARYIIGIAATIGIMTGLKIVLPEHYAADFFRYLLVGAWVTFFWPAAGIGLRLFNRRSRV